MADRPQAAAVQLPAAPNDTRVLAHDLPALRLEPVTAPNVERVTKEFPFSGAQVLRADPLTIGERNYALVENFRYLDTGLISVNGYSVIADPHATYVKGRSGIQLVKLISGMETSHVLVHARTSDDTASAVILADGGIPAADTYESQPLWLDATGSAVGRFSLAPNGHVAYCNEQESTIWGTMESRVAAFFVVNAAGTIRKDYTIQVNNIDDHLSNQAIIHLDGSTAPWVLIGTSRPLKGLKWYVEQANTASVTATVKVWTAGGWTTVSGFVDGTAAGGKTLDHTGVMSFTTTEPTAAILVEAGLALYFYRIELSGATSAGTSVSYVTVDAPWQTIKDVWDGTPRSPTQAQLQISTPFEWQDVSLEVLEADNVPAIIKLNSKSTEQLLVGFDERQTALRLEVGPRNDLAAAVAVDFWDGSSWQAVVNLVDGTKDSGGTKTLNQSGLVTWTQQPETNEFTQTLFGITAYYYKLHFTADLTDGTAIDLITGIPASRTLRGFRFPFRFQNRLFLMGDIEGNQGHAAEYSVTNTNDVWNGPQASGETQRLFFGDNAQAALTGAVEIYNRFAGSLAYVAIVCTGTQTFLLSGNDPSSFAIFPISKHIGCPAPLTMISAEVGYSVAEDAQRNVAAWLSYQGPMICDASVLLPVPGLEIYFDPNHPAYINTDAIDVARGWYDTEYAEWNLTFPSGASVTNNVWVAYDFKRKRWFHKVPVAYLGAAIPVEDRHGRKYTYGTIDVGTLLRLEHRHVWTPGNPIIAKVVTADILPGQSSWVETRLRHLRVVAVRKALFPNTLILTHIGDGQTSTPLAAMDVAAGGSRYVDFTQPVNLLATSHQLQFVIDTGLFDAQVELLAWSGLWEIEREHA